ncbi:MAG TPA: glycine cleavage system protein GcvH [Candidatus Omnitrophota bacterium]|nr:glycine cleavage system protein GcvH [Candidatus Omnitrophota bacterium]HRK61144.1 glycine cleavage system protein GcvH [Candidatus Omnitrophota bacterium]
MNFPENLKYTKTHEWISVNGATAKVGITEYAQKEISDVVFVELPKVAFGAIKEKGAAVVESVKAAFDIYAPVSGVVTAVNKELESNPGLVNQDCYGTGWFFELQLSDPGQVATLMSAKDYAAHIQSAAH